MAGRKLGRPYGHPQLGKVERQIVLDSIFGNKVFRLVQYEKTSTDYG